MLGQGRGFLGGLFTGLPNRRNELQNSAVSMFKRIAPGRVSIDGVEITGMVLLETGSFALAATKDIALDAYFSLGYKSFQILVHRIRPAADLNALHGRVSTDSGSVFLSGAGDYDQAITEHSAAAQALSAPATSSSIVLASQTSVGIGNLSNEGCSGRITIYNPNDTTFDVAIAADFVGVDANGRTFKYSNYSTVNAAGDVTDFRLYFASGNIAAAGAYSLLGIR